MGGTESVFPHGKIAVKLDKKYYAPGEEVRGKILIGLEKEFPGNSVCLKLQALENSYFRRGGSKHYLGHDCLYSNKTRIFVFPHESTPAGNYEIPFRFPLIKGIPSSVLEESLKFKAEISYMIKGVLQSSNKKKAHNMKNEIHVHVCEKPPLAEYHDIRQDESLTVSSFGCMRKGVSKISIHSPKSVFTNGDNVKLAISVDNSRCLVDLNGFVFHLLSTYELRDDEGYTHHVERVVNMTKIKQKIRAGTKTEQDKPIMSNIPLMFPRSKRMEMQSTATGQLVQHRYHVKIIPNYDLLVGGAESLYVPISFYQHAPEQKFETPKEWKVQVMPEKQVQWSEETKYESKKTSKPAKEEWIRSHSRRMSRVSLKASESTESLGKSKSMDKSRKTTRKMSDVSSSEILFTEKGEIIQEIKV